MGNTDSIEKMVAWQKSTEVAKEIYLLTGAFPSNELTGLAAQLRQAIVSTTASLAEASSETAEEYKFPYYKQANTHCIETICLVELAHQLGLLALEPYTSLMGQLDEISHLTKELSFGPLGYAPSSDAAIAQPDLEYYFHPTATIDSGASIGKDTRIWHYSHIMARAIIGNGCSLGQNVMVSDDVILGNNVKVQNNVSIYTGVICEDDVFIGPSVVFTNVTNPRSAVSRKNQFLRTLVKQGASIGANATIVCGHDIGRYAFIGAGAVVTKQVPDYALLVGNPARQIGWMSAHGHRLDFGPDNKATCPGSGDTYLLDQGTVKPV
ncbi:MAG TPA: four helix bundle protein [Saprospiraceae bacterium]|nr:four helix bundle protein [Saprospiraceae bacterium]MCB9269996.1 four helix bundle protein [Lewinellaceae bacterium]HPG09234.1 four helix bundle protein [Saprospiraceae bacterium]HQU54542.1 four helix bundle protein [Saprospiraceae bacterium]HRV87428.1 four helix bundle protein [Saprospiraceae bacterium]